MEIEPMVTRLGSLGKNIANAELARRREVFRLLVERIDLKFDHCEAHSVRIMRHQVLPEGRRSMDLEGGATGVRIAGDPTVRRDGRRSPAEGIQET